MQLQAGAPLPDVRVAYVTYGTLAPERDNVIVYPTRFGGTHEDNAYLVGPGMALDLARYFVVVPHLLGNGISTSPSTTGSTSRS